MSFCPRCGKYSESNYCPDCGVDLRAAAGQYVNLRDSPSPQPQARPSGSIGLGALAGFLLLILLGSIPILGALISGFVAGLIARGGRSWRARWVYCRNHRSGGPYIRSYSRWSSNRWIFRTSRTWRSLRRTSRWHSSSSQPRERNSVPYRRTLRRSPETQIARNQSSRSLTVRASF